MTMLDQTEFTTGAYLFYGTVKPTTIESISGYRTAMNNANTVG